MNLFSDKEKSILQTERAINDIKLGSFVLVNKKYLTAAAENLHCGKFTEIKEIFKAKIYSATTKNRAKHALNRDVAVFDLSDKSFADLQAICFSSSPSLPYPSLVALEEESIEAAISLVKLAKLLPTVLVICASGIASASLQGIIEVTTTDLKEYNDHINNELDLICSADLKLQYADKAQISVFRASFTKEEHYAITVGDLNNVEIPTIRIHSSCYTGDLLGSLSCDCGDQLKYALMHMGSSPGNGGIIIYLMQEGRGIGFVNKLRTYSLQSEGYDTVQANEILGFDRDERNFSSAAAILKKLNITKANLLTNNPRKVAELERYEVKINQIIPIVKKNIYNERYLETKKIKMGHNI